MKCDSNTFQFHTVAIVKVPAQLNFSFTSQPDDDITFPSEMDCLNFCELAIGAKFGKAKTEKAYLLAISEDGEEKAVMPSMLSLNRDIVRQDCLCYLMERLNDF